ncbi:DUF5359 family protein [Cohnella sp.]|uniref:DUF5359 family protein n=1 Tax=Cohnella sp. TaxID=1883426 RepID=UPI003569BD74
MERDDDNSTRPDFTAWSDRVEKILKRVIVILVIFLCIAQLILQFPSARHLLTTTDSSEGVPFHYISH